MSNYGDPFAVRWRQALKGRYVYPCPACHGTGDDCENCEGSGSCFMTKDESVEYGYEAMIPTVGDEE